MEILYGERGSGKTTELIRMSNERWIYIVCVNRQRVDNIVKMAEKMGLEIPYPICIAELPLKSPHIKEILIDDLEDLLWCITGKKINTVTTSSDIMILNNNKNK